MSTTESGSPKRVALVLHASLDEVIQAIERQELKANRLGDEYVVTREQLDEFTRNGNPFARRAGVAVDVTDR
jgi:hypothetical protein